jgi:hypothetical protein
VAKYSAYRSWRRWYGTLADIAHVADAAAYEMVGWMPKGAAVDVTVEYRQGSVASGLTIEQFRNLPNTDLPRVRRIEIVVGEPYGVPRTRIIAIAGISPTMRLEVNAAEQSRAEGLATRLASILDGGGSWLGGLGSAVVSSVFIALVGIIFLVFLLIPSRSLTPIWRASISVGVVALLAAAVLVMPLFPWLELLPPSGRTRGRRFGGLVLTVLVAVGASVLGSLLFGLLQQH